MADEWDNSPLRMRVIQQLEEHIRQSPNACNKSAQELEYQVYKQCKSKEDYMAYVKRILSAIKGQAPANQNQHNPHLAAMLSRQEGASSGSQIGHANQVDHVNPGNAQDQVMSGPTPVSVTGMQTGIRMGQPVNVQGGGDAVVWHSARRVGDMPVGTMNVKQVNISNMAAMGGQVGKIGSIQIPVNPGVQMGTVMSGQMIRAPGMQPRIPSPNFQQSSGPAGQQLNPAASNMSSSISHASPMASNAQLSGSNQTSPAFISPSPSNMVPSPASAGTGVGKPTRLGVPSPGGGMVNTPGQPHSQQLSPANNQTEEKAYMEKVRQLQKYIEPLQRVIRNKKATGNEEVDASVAKMKALLEVLQNPERRTPIAALSKCEKVLEKLELSFPQSKENPMQVLTDAVSLANSSPRGAHTIYRTLSPALNTLLGPTISLPLAKQIKKDDHSLPPPEMPNISDIVQGEVARLPSRFKVNLDCHQPPGSDDLTLICQLDDVNLPCVPPVTLVIPSDYPLHPPFCNLSSVVYETTDFFKSIKEIMKYRQQSLPLSCTITMLLDTWEMSVRQACSPKSCPPDAISPFQAVTQLVG